MSSYRTLAGFRDFTALWTGQTISEIGSRMTMFVFPLLTYALTGSALLAAASEALHLLGLAGALLPAGALADRVDRRRIMRFASGAGVLLYTSLMVAGLLGTITVPHLLGTARDVLTALDLAGAGMRNSHRMLPATPLRWMAPATLRDEMRADLARGLDTGTSDERLAVADATIDAFFMARHINVTWFIDGEAGQVFPTQHDGELRGWHPTVISYLFPEGTFVYLDGGELNLGVVRDSTLNGKNDFQMFDENWEEVAFVGAVSYRLAMTVSATGAAAGTITPSASDVATS